MLVGELINVQIELCSADNEICDVSQLLHGADALIILFMPFCHGEKVPNSMESLASDINSRLEEFSDNDIRVIAISREPPSTIRHWVNDVDLQFEVFSDYTLEFCNSLVGSFDLSLYVQATKGVYLGSYFVSMPGVAVIGGDGKILSKYVASSPETVQMTADELLRLTGL